MLRLGALCLLAGLVMGPAVGCKQEDPVAVRLAQRNGYDVELTGWNWRGGPDSGQVMLNVNITCGTQQPLGRLTLLIEEIGPGGDAAIAKRRHTIDVSKLQYDLPQPTLITIDGVNQAVEEGGFVISVEPSPARGEFAEFPELADLKQ